MTTTAKNTEELRERGYTLLKGRMGTEWRAALRARLAELFEQEGERAGSEFRTEPEARRLANLVNKGNVFHDVVRHPALLACAEAVFAEPFKLSSLNARLAKPHSREGQPLHADMGLLADEHGPKGMNSVWMLDPFRSDNGTLRVVPGSHRTNRLPQELLADAHASHPEEEVVLGEAGDVLVFQSHLWHAGLPNQSSEPRLALNCFFCRHDQAQQTWQDKWLDDTVKADLEAPMRSLLALDDAENDRLCREPVETSGFMKK